MTAPNTPLEARLQQLAAWSLDAHRASIHKAWTFDSFDAAVLFFNRVAELAKAHDHHPEIVSCYTDLRVRLWTHEAGGLTDRDFALARAIDQLERPNGGNRMGER